MRMRRFRWFGVPLVLAIAAALAACGQGTGSGDFTDWTRTRDVSEYDTWTWQDHPSVWASREEQEDWVFAQLDDVREVLGHEESWYVERYPEHSWQAIKDWLRKKLPSSSCMVRGYNGTDGDEWGRYFSLQIQRDTPEDPYGEMDALTAHLLSNGWQISEIFSPSRGDRLQLTRAENEDNGEIEFGASEHAIFVVAKAGCSFGSSSW